MPDMSIMNRKQRRTKAKQERSKDVTKRDPSYWVKRVVAEMKDSKRVQDLVVSGKLDAYLK